jgi:secreted Zn-dependent insulinase-like peptidase
MNLSIKQYLILSIIFLSSCSFKPSFMTTTNIIQSENDTRAYEAFTLENQLEVLIISDPDEDKAAASLDVFVGSASDPENRAGLAHFLEHMLFLGTEKYPDPNDYLNFIAQHGGSRNAYTAKEHTNLKACCIAA